MSNVCTRCGKERIIIKEWVEKFETERRFNSIHHMKTACPDPECQKIVEQGIARERQKFEERKAEKIENERIQKEERQKRMEHLVLRSNKRK